MDDLRRLKDAASGKITDPKLREGLAKAASDAVIVASSALEGAESVAKRSGMTTRNGDVSKRKVLVSLLTPRSTGRSVLDAAAAEIQERREGRSQSQESPEVDAPRDIPVLFPVFFEDGLKGAGKQVSPSNIAAVAGLTSANIALNSHRWLEVLGTAEVARDWSELFGGADGDLESMGRRPDRMIDFLWMVSPRLHSPLHDLVGQMRDTIVSAAGRFDRELPLDMWGIDND